VALGRPQMTTPNRLVLKSALTCPHCTSCNALLRSKAKGLLRVLISWIGEMSTEAGVGWVLRCHLAFCRRTGRIYLRLDGRGYWE
jgi:hypothetical protein